MATKNKRPFVIGISGACGSGKTWFANKLKEGFRESVCVFTLDSYSKDEDFVNGLEFRYDNPQAVDYDKAYEDLLKLLHGLSIKLPIYDYSCHCIISEKACASPSVIIIEGLYAFYDSRFLKSMDFKIWIDADEHTRMDRRIKRDVKERGDSYEKSYLRHINDSEPAFKKYYAIEKTSSDCVYFNISNSVEETPKLVNLIVCFYESR